jgi:hypothetical protein
MIHGREKHSRSVYGLFLGVSADLELYYLKARFMLEPAEGDIEWGQFLSLLNASDEKKDDEGEDGPLAKYGEKLHTYIETERILITEKRELDAKTIERCVTYFCTDSLDISAVTFVDLSSMDISEVLALMPFLNDEQDGDDAGGGSSGDWQENDGQEDSDEIFIECAPVIDPISGVAVSKLTVGQSVCCRLPEDSPFCKICAASLPDFDGIVSGEVTGVKVNEFGGAVVAVNLAEGISGAMKIQGSVWIKAVRGPSDGTPDSNEVPRSILISAIGVAVLLCAIGILFHFLSLG